MSRSATSLVAKGYSLRYTEATGTYKDPAGYFVDEAEAEAFDIQFPPKEKRKLPGQLF